MTDATCSFVNDSTIPKPLVGLRTLVVGEKYTVCHIERFDTKFGRRIKLELETKTVFLGARYNKIPDERIASLLRQAEQGLLYIISNGPVKNNAIDVKFHNYEDDDK